MGSSIVVKGVFFGSWVAFLLNVVGTRKTIMKKLHGKDETTNWFDCTLNYFWQVEGFSWKIFWASEFSNSLLLDLAPVCSMSIPGVCGQGWKGTRLKSEVASGSRFWDLLWASASIPLYRSLTVVWHWMCKVPGKVTSFSQATGDGWLSSYPVSSIPKLAGKPGRTDRNVAEVNMGFSPLEKFVVFYWKIIAASSEEVIREAMVLNPAPPWLAVIFGQTNGGKPQASIE